MYLILPAEELYSFSFGLGLIGHLGAPNYMPYAHRIVLLTQGLESKLEWGER